MGAKISQQHKNLILLHRLLKVVVEEVKLFVNSLEVEEAEQYLREVIILVSKEVAVALFVNQLEVEEGEVANLVNQEKEEGAK